MITIDRLCYRSKLRTSNAGEKLAYAVVTLIICVAGRSVLIAGLVLLINTILTVAVGGIPAGRYARLMTVPVGFLLLSTLALMINVSSIPLDAYAIPIGSFYLTSSINSLQFGGRLILTALAAVSCLYFLSLSTPLTDIIMMLEKIHCPRILTELMLLIYRFIFILLETASAIRTSQHCRLGYKDLRTSVRSFGKMGSALFIRAFQKSQRLYEAMESRCYNGRLQVLTEEYPPRQKEVIAIVMYELVLLGLLLWRN